MTCKKTLISIDVYSVKMFKLFCICTQNRLCKGILTLLRRSHFVTLGNCLSKYSHSLVMNIKNKQTNKEKKNKYEMV